MERQMNTFDNLVVRACKSRDPETRLRSLFRRYYLVVDPTQIKYMLAQIVSQYNRLSVIKFMEELAKYRLRDDFLTSMNPDHELGYYFDDHETHALINALALSTTKAFPGYRPGLNWRVRFSEAEVTES